MSEEAISESDLEPSLNSEEEYLDNEEEEGEEEEDMEDDEDENDGDDEDDEPSSQPPSRPASPPSSGAPSRPASQSQVPTSPESANKSNPPSSKTKKQKASKSTKSSKSSKGSKPSKPAKLAHMRKNIRKLLKEDQLEAGTKAAQQEEMERRKRLEQQRKDFPAPVPVFPDAQLVSHLVPALLSKQDVICLDSSGDEDEKMEPQFPALAIRDDIIELSSGDEDALQISSESADEDADGTVSSEESSGAHINDTLNMPDAQGQVLVNINHPAEENDIYLAPQLARAVKPHQVGGIRFLYDNLIESLERYKTSSGFGCILAHSMGLGKTLQVISFIDILLRNTEAHTVLTIVPVNTLQNWLTEFNLWLPPQEALSPDTDPSLLTGRTFKVHILNDEHKTTLARAKVVEDWSRDGGVLLMGYEMYRLLSMKKSFVMGKKRKSKKPMQMFIVIYINRLIHVVICDEGHRIKNYHTSTSQALKNIRSRRRVVLTGYPLQNNLIEYWCMVDFVRPDFLGTRQEFSNMFERPILNGQCVDSTPQDVRLMRYRSHVLHSLLEGFVQRRGHDVLQDQLPSKEEHVILVRLSPIQRALYTEFMKRFREAGNSGWLGLNPLKAFCVCCKIWNHPDVLYEALQKENQANEQDLDLDDITSASNTRCPAPGAGLKAKVADSSNSKVNNTLPPLNPSQERANQVITYEWAKDIMSNYHTGVLQNSAKLVLLFHLIEESVRKGDKLLVFSQSLSTLTVIEDFLSKRPIPTDNPSTVTQNQNWIRNLNYYRLDGSTSASERERLINQFNDPENIAAWLFLLSTRSVSLAGCLGVNLIGANRVVVFDASWNPCHDAQAVCRVYRYGQRKPCHIYRLVCDFTLEKKIYDRQVSKQGMSDRVVDDLNPMLNFTRKEVESLLHFVEEEHDAERISLGSAGEFESVIYQACQIYPHLITKKPFHHESLLVDRKESKLTKAEKRAAKKSYEDEKRASVPYSRPSYAPYYPTSDQTLTNIPARAMARPDDKPVASVRPIQSTPIPMMPRQVGMGLAGSSSAGSLPVNFLQKAGVHVQRIVTTSDIVIPGANSTTDVQARISAGESIHVIRGSKGTYIRTNDGRIFAIRSGKISRPAVGGSAASRDAHGSLIHQSSNGCSSPLDQQQRSPNGEQRVSSPLSAEILRELSRYTSSTGDVAPGVGNELPSPPIAGDGGSTQNSQTGDLSRQLADNLLSSALEMHGTKRKSTERQGNTQMGSKRTSAAARFHGMSTGPSGLSFPPVGLNSSSLMGNLGHMSHPLLMGGNLLRQSAPRNGHHPPPSSSSSMSTGFSPASTTVPMSSPPSATTSSSLAPGSLPPYLMNPNMAGLLSSGFPLNYSQSLLSEPRMFPTPLLSGSGGFPVPNSSSSTSSFLSHYNNPTSSLLGAALTQPDRLQGTENGGSSSDDDVIEVMGQ
uniref:Helicase ARIP4-like n=1 Tax=Scophthalmus maximus TaxID=52904 RepID=A0A8D3BHA4_SCOMX